MKKMKKKKLKLPPEQPPLEVNWDGLRGLISSYKENLSALVGKLVAASRSTDEILEDMYELVHDPKSGEDGKDHIDDVKDDAKLIKSLASATFDVFMVQEMTKIFGLDKSVRSKLMTAYINKHPVFRPPVPRMPRQQQTQPAIVVHENPEKPESRPVTKKVTFPSFFLNGKVRKDGP